MSDKPVRDYDKFMLRFPDGMRDAIADRAKKNGRSMNSEIVQIIEDALDDYDDLIGDSVFASPDEVDYSRPTRMKAIAYAALSMKNEIDDHVDSLFKRYQEVINLYESISDEEYDKHHQEWHEKMAKILPTWKL